MVRNVFGPGQDRRSPYSGAVSLFAERLRQGGGVDIFGDGKQTRDYVCVEDVVRALMLTLEAAAVTAPVFNVCTGATACRSLSRRASFSAAVLGFRAGVLLAVGLEATLRHIERREPALV